METFSNSQNEQFELLSAKSIEECLIQALSETCNDSCFNRNNCFCDGTKCNDCDASCF